MSEDMFAFPYGIEGQDDLEGKIDEQCFADYDTHQFFGSWSSEDEDDELDVEVNYEDALYNYQAPGTGGGRRRSVVQGTQAAPTSVNGFGLDLSEIVAPYPISYLPPVDKDLTFVRHVCENNPCLKCLLDEAFKDALPPPSTLALEILSSTASDSKNRDDKTLHDGVAGLSLAVDAPFMPPATEPKPQVNAPLSQAARLLNQTLRDAPISPLETPRDESPLPPTPARTSTPVLSLRVLADSIHYSFPLPLPLPSLCLPAVQSRITNALAAALRDEMPRPRARAARTQAAAGKGGASRSRGGSAMPPPCACTDLCFCRAKPWAATLSRSPYPHVPSSANAAGEMSGSSPCASPRRAARSRGSAAAATASQGLPAQPALSVAATAHPHAPTHITHLTNPLLHSRRWKQSSAGANARTLLHAMQRESGWCEWLAAETQHCAKTVQLLGAHRQESASLEAAGSMAEDTTSGELIVRLEDQLCKEFGYLPRHATGARGEARARPGSLRRTTSKAATQHIDRGESRTTAPDASPLRRAGSRPGTGLSADTRAPSAEYGGVPVRGQAPIPVRTLRLRFEQQLLRAERRARDKANAERLLGDKDRASVEATVQRAVRNALRRRRRRKQRAETAQDSTSPSPPPVPDVEHVHALLRRL